MTNIAARILAISKIWKMIFKLSVIIGCVFSLIPTTFAQQPPATEKNRKSRPHCGNLRKISGNGAHDFSLLKATTFHALTVRRDRAIGPQHRSRSSAQRSTLSKRAGRT
jgi:hypothetical protein